MKKLFPILFFILFYNVTTAQSNNDSATIDISLFKNFRPINNQCFVFIDSDNVINTGNILNEAHWANCGSLQLKNNIVPLYWLYKTVYLKFTLKNGAPFADTVHFHPGTSFQSISLYAIIKGNKLQLIKDESKADGFQPIKILGYEKTTYIAVLHFTKRALNILYPQIIQQDAILKVDRLFYTASYNQLVVGYILSGALLMMIFFNGTNYHESRKIEFLYNCCYALCMFCLIFLNTYIQKRSGVFASFFMSYLAFALLIIGMVFYIAFTRKFLNTEKNYPLLNKIFSYEEKGLMILLVIYSCIHFLTNLYWLQNLFENFMKVILLGIGILYIITGITKKNKLLNYLAIGNSIFIFFSLISLILILFPFNGNSIFTSAIIYFEIGIVCELIFYLLGLSYKNRIELIEKIKEQETLKLQAEKQIFKTKIAVLNAQQAERNRISADMHDDLGAGVTAIRLFSELAKSRLGNDTIPEIEKISSSADELLNNMNAIIWTMNSSNDSFTNMVAYIRSYAIEYFENTGVNCQFTIDIDLPDFVVSGYIRRNIFLVVKEALNNILKHAKATEVSLILKKEARQLSFYIKDNGNGLDLENLRRFGNGLKNMKGRMDKSGIDFFIENNNGTLVTLRFNLN